MGDAKDYLWMDTGRMTQVRVGKGPIPRFNVETAEHLWVWALLFSADPDDDAPVLDGRNLMRADGPACFYCEQDCSPDVVNKSCRGPAWLQQVCDLIRP